MEFTEGMRVIRIVGNDRGRVVRVARGYVTIVTDGGGSHTFPVHFGGWRFDRESYARKHGWTLAELEQFESTYGVNAEDLDAARLQADVEFKALPPWERTPDTYRQA